MLAEDIGTRLMPKGVPVQNGHALEQCAEAAVPEVFDLFGEQKRFLKIAPRLGDIGIGESAAILPKDRHPRIDLTDIRKSVSDRCGVQPKPDFEVGMIFENLFRGFVHQRDCRLCDEHAADGLLPGLREGLEIDAVAAERGIVPFIGRGGFIYHFLQFIGADVRVAAGCRPAPGKAPDDANAFFVRICDDLVGIFGRKIAPDDQLVQL